MIRNAFGDWVAGLFGPPLAPRDAAQIAALTERLAQSEAARFALVEQLAEACRERDRFEEADTLKALTIHGLHQLAAWNGFDLREPFSVTDIIKERDEALRREQALLEGNRVQVGLLQDINARWEQAFRPRMDAIRTIAQAGAASRNGTARKLARIAREALE